MPKVQVIINQINTKCPSSIPQITQVFQSDPLRISEALKQKRSDPHEIIMLKILLSDCLYKLKSKDFFKPLSEINLIDLRRDVTIEARLKICEGIILSEDIYRTTTIEKHLSDLLLTPNLKNIEYARIEAISAGNNFLKGDYCKAAMQYLTASRMEAYLEDEEKKIQLINLSISFIFIAPISPQSHKVICSLCLNQTAKKSKLFSLVTKLYKQDIFTSEEIQLVQDYLPNSLKNKDNQGITKVSQAAFSRNMIPIINSFSTIKIETLKRLIGVKDIDELMLLLEKTYFNGEVKIDEIKQIVRIAQRIEASSLVRDFLSEIDQILQE